MSCYEEQRELCAWMESGEGRPLPAIERARLAVHRNTFVGTLVEALGESFPVSRALAGAWFFDAMARTRVLVDPPRSPVLTDYLLSFPEFVAGFAPAQSAPVIAEMTRFEALRLRAFHAADASAVGLDEFHRLACDAALLESTGARLHPAAHWLPARHALLPLWQAHMEADDIAAVDLGHIHASDPASLLVHRPQFEVRARELPAGAVDFLEALAAGDSIARAFARTTQACPQAEPAVLFSLLLQEGLVTKLFELSTENP